MEQKKSKTIEDSNLIGSMVFMKQNNYLKESKSTLKFDSVKEAEENAKEEIELAVKEKLNAIKQDISFLQKKGRELHLEGIMLLEIPLKIKVWRSNVLKKELEKIYEILNKVMATTQKLLVEEEAKEKQKESLEKQKEEIEKQRKETEKRKEDQGKTNKQKSIKPPIQKKENPARPLSEKIPKKQTPQ